MGSTKISGVAVFDLMWQEDRLVVFSENDQTLRRFGQVDLVRLSAGSPLETHRGGGADEIWALVQGEATLELKDLREESPSADQQLELVVNADAPQAVLIPFGVQARITASQPGLLLRATSHADPMFAGDRIFKPVGE